MGVFWEVLWGMLSWLLVFIWIPAPLFWLLWKTDFFDLSVKDEDYTEQERRVLKMDK